MDGDFSRNCLKWGKNVHVSHYGTQPRSRIQSSSVCMHSRGTKNSLRFTEVENCMDSMHRCQVLLSLLRILVHV